MKTNDYIVTAEGYLIVDSYENLPLTRLNNKINNIMDLRGYSLVEIDFLRRESPLKLMTFRLDEEGVFPLEQGKIKKLIGKKESHTERINRHSETLKLILDEFPYQVTFIFDFKRVSNSPAYGLRIKSEPTIVWKTRQIPNYDYRSWFARYQEIIDYNMRFVEDILDSIAFTRTKPTTTLSEPKSMPNSPLFDDEFIQKTPKSVRECLTESDICYMDSAFRACSVMLRTAIEEAVRLKILQEKHKKDLYDKEEYEINLTRKLNLLKKILPNLTYEIENMKLIKWYGDKGTHAPKNPIVGNDIEKHIPKLVDFFMKLDLK